MELKYTKSKRFNITQLLCHNCRKTLVCDDGTDTFGIIISHENANIILRQYPHLQKYLNRTQFLWYCNTKICTWTPNFMCSKCSGYPIVILFIDCDKCLTKWFEFIDQIISFYSNANIYLRIDNIIIDRIRNSSHICNNNLLLQYIMDNTVVKIKDANQSWRDSISAASVCNKNTKAAR